MIHTITRIRCENTPFQLASNQLLNSTSQHKLGQHNLSIDLCPNCMEVVVRQAVSQFASVLHNAFTFSSHIRLHVCLGLI